MNNRRRLLMLLLALLLMAAIASTVVSQDRSNANVDLSWFVISASGGHGTSASYTMNATLGQPIVDLGSGATTRLSAGFWQTVGISHRVFLPIMLK